MSDGSKTAGENRRKSGGEVKSAEGPRYQLGSVIGKGGMAEVFSAVDQQLARIVAVKLLNKETQEEEALCARFVDEAYVLAGLSHPGVVPIYEFGVLPDGRYFYAMKEVSGVTLRAMLRKRGPEEAATVESILEYTAIFERICETVAYAHAKGIIHRDLKPENIMLDEHGSVFVMDWGLAKDISGQADVSSQRTMAGEILGSPSYMAPEQAEGRTSAATMASDVFSLGVILYEILSGSRPFLGKTVDETMQEILLHTPDPPRAVNRAAGRELSAICMKALEKDPRRRYPSAKELLADIKNFRELRAVSAAPPSMLNKIQKWARRSPTTAAALCTVLVVALIFGGVYAVRSYHNRLLIAQMTAAINASRLELAKVEALSEEQRRSLGGASPESTKSAEAERSLQELEAKRELLERRLLGGLAVLIGNSLRSPDEHALAEARAANFAVIDRYLREDKTVQAGVLAEEALKTAKGRNFLRYSAADIVRLQKIRDNAQH